MLELGANDSTKIYWAASKGSQVFLNNMPVDISGSLIVSPSSTANYSLNTSGDTTDSKEITVQVLPAEEINRSLDRNVYSSSFAKYFPAVNAVDGNPSTFWKSKNEATPWIYVDFEKEINFERVVLDWGNNYAISYRLQAVSASNVITTIYEKTNGNGGKENILLNGSGRYLRLLCTQKLFADSGYVLKEFEIYGRGKVTEVVNETNSVQQFELFQNYPNPFNPTTQISYSIPNSELVSLKVYNVLGEEVAQLVNQFQNNGKYQVTLNTNQLSSGVYFYQLKAGDFVSVKKMLLIR
jgi:hypothetical protein